LEGFADSGFEALQESWNIEGDIDLLAIHRMDFDADADTSEGGLAFAVAGHASHKGVG
jgi:hypothetical protein